jgi:hypothetical protein
MQLLLPRVVVQPCFSVIGIEYVELRLWCEAEKPAHAGVICQAVAAMPSAASE